jgi:hypothetical protein
MDLQTHDSGPTTHENTCAHPPIPWNGVRRRQPTLGLPYRYDVGSQHAWGWLHHKPPQSKSPRIKAQIKAQIKGPTESTSTTCNSTHWADWTCGHSRHGRLLGLLGSVLQRPKDFLNLVHRSSDLLMCSPRCREVFLDRSVSFRIRHLGLL